MIRSIWIVALIACLVYLTQATKLSKFDIVEAFDDCPNNCTYPQGTCNVAGKCICAGGFGTVDCSVAIVPILTNQIVSLDLQPGQWALLSFAATDDLFELAITMERSSSGGDPDLYVRFGDWPDRTHYDYFDFNPEAMHSVLIDRPELQTGSYVIGVYAYGQVATTAVLAVHSYQCPNDCSGHGTCDPVAHTCSCNPTYINNDCSASLQPLPQPKATVDGVVDELAWAYFELEVQPAQSHKLIDLQVILMDRTAHGAPADINLFVAHGRFPSESDFDYYSLADGTQNDQSILICSSQLMSGKYMIAVQNWGIEPAAFTIDTTLILNCPRKCNGNGACVAGVCVCSPTDRWTGNDCSVDLDLIYSGRISTGSVVGLAFFFLILGAAPFILYQLLGDKIRAWIYANAEEERTRALDEPDTSAGNIQEDAEETQEEAHEDTEPVVKTGAYQTF